MTTTARQLDVTLERIERLTNTVNGNPRFAITWERDTDGSLVTRQLQSDAGVGYAIGNPGLRVGDRVRLTLTKAERIANIEPLS